MLHLLAAVVMLLRATHSTAAPLPNLLLFSVDDAPSASAFDTIYVQTIIASAARNPNGCRPPVTWFTASCAGGKCDGSCDVVQSARRRGHELATHTRTHPKDGDTFSLAQWATELDGQRAWLGECGVPAGEVVGFRAPYFLVNNALGASLHRLGFVYDSSISGRDPLQPAFVMAGRNMSAQPCGEACSGWGTLNLWEVPAYVLPGRGSAAGRRVDPAPAEGMTIAQRLVADFERKRGSGVPVSVMVHAPYLEDGATRLEVVQFLQWALGQPNTWLLTYSQYIQWLKAPPGTQVASIAAQSPCDL